MGTFVLIHGAFHGGWCWYKVVPLLEKQGHTVLALDLPGHGRDKTPVAAVTLQLYVDSVCKLLDAQREPVILVGHSMGGGIITQVAEERPERIKCLVYLAGALPRNGQSMFDLSGLRTTRSRRRWPIL
jgi:pimeloyl-ACP methyl ester carboxylesterase